MRKISLIVAFAVVLASPSMAGSNQGFHHGSLPGIGAFSYSGSPVAVPAPTMVIARLTTADRS